MTFPCVAGAKGNDITKIAKPSDNNYLDSYSALRGKTTAELLLRKTCGVVATTGGSRSLFVALGHGGVVVRGGLVAQISKTGGRIVCPESKYRFSTLQEMLNCKNVPTAEMAKILYWKTFWIRDALALRPIVDVVRELILRETFGRYQLANNLFYSKHALLRLFLLVATELDVKFSSVAFVLNGKMNTFFLSEMSERQRTSDERKYLFSMSSLGGTIYLSEPNMFTDTDIQKVRETGDFLSFCEFAFRSSQNPVFRLASLEKKKQVLIKP